MPIDPLFATLLLVLGLGFFFGLAFEVFHKRKGVARPGGIRTFFAAGADRGGTLPYRYDPPAAALHRVGRAGRALRVRPTTL